MVNRKVRYWISLTVVLTFLIGLIIPTAAIGTEAVEPTDISEHWAKDKIIEWVKRGLVSGYPDGTFRPDKSIIRA